MWETGLSDHFYLYFSDDVYDGVANDHGSVGDDASNHHYGVGDDVDIYTHDN